MEAIEDPNKGSLEVEYQRFLMMDILHLKKEEIEVMDIIEYSNALSYSYITFVRRDFAGILSKMFGEKQNISSSVKHSVEFENPYKEDLLEYQRQCGLQQEEERKKWLESLKGMN